MKESYESNFLAAAIPGGIEAQEKRGQSWLQTAGVLPRLASWPQLEALGFVRGNDYDELFVHVTMPEGWTIERTDHDMNSKLLDDKGSERGSIFYKAAFYDRRADMRLTRRYRTNSDYSDDGTTLTLSVIDEVSGKTLFSQQVARPAMVRPQTDETREEWRAYSTREDAAYKACTAWLAEHFPDYENPLAYWDAP